MSSPAQTGPDDPIAYRRLAAALRQALTRGDFAEGRQLPTEAELSLRHGLSRQTVRRALQDLVAEGLVYRVRGRGTFATGISPGSRYLRSFGSIEDLLALAVDSTMETLRPLERRVDIEAAGRLRLDSDEVMLALTRRAHDGTPFSVSRMAFPLDIGRAIAATGALRTPGEVTAATALSTVDAVAPRPIAGAQQSVTAVAVPEDVQPLLDLPTGSPALRIDRLYTDAIGTPVELAVTWFHPERYAYRVELSRGPASA
jgi:DNA-binding GntR family transcriptional regulator